MRAKPALLSPLSSDKSCFTNRSYGRITIVARGMTGLKPLRWIASSKDDLSAMPREVRRDVGYALYVAQQGDKDADAKVLTGFGGAGVIEVIARHDGDTFRAVYTVRFAGVVYVLHAFQKKAKRGIATPKKEMDLIRKRLKLAERDYRQLTAAGGAS